MRPLFLSLSSAVRSRENERERGWELETEQTQLLFARKWTVWLTGRSIPPMAFVCWTKRLRVSEVSGCANSLMA